MTTEAKPIHPSQQELYDRLDCLSDAVEACIKGITGSRSAFVLTIVAAEPGHAGMSITNAAEWPGAIHQLQAAVDSLKAKHAEDAAASHLPTSEIHSK